MPKNLLKNTIVLLQANVPNSNMHCTLLKKFSPLLSPDTMKANYQELSQGPRLVGHTQHLAKMLSKDLHNETAAEHVERVRNRF